jgi:hypothetical protein
MCGTCSFLRVFQIVSTSNKQALFELTQHSPECSRQYISPFPSRARKMMWAKTRMPPRALRPCRKDHRGTASQERTGAEASSSSCPL